MMSGGQETRLILMPEIAQPLFKGPGNERVLVETG